MKVKIYGFDGLRGLSVLMVIMSHGVLWPKIGVTSEAVTSIFSAQVGVNIFFTLSGFLITHLLLQERAATGQISILSFAARRALRIFPLYFLAITLMLVLDYFAIANVNKCSWLYAYTYTMNFAPKSCNHQTLSHFWSLAVEEHFYLVWPVVFMLSARLAFIFAVIIAFACIYFGLSLYSDTDTYYLTRWTFPAAAPIAFGCIAAYICKYRYVVNVFSNKLMSVVILIVAISGLATPGFFKSDAVWLLSISTLIIYIYHNQSSVLVRVFSVKPLVAIGIVSYGLYVWQGVFTGNGPYRTGAAFPPALGIGLFLTFLAAPISYIFFERPIMRMKERFQWRKDFSRDLS